MSAFVDTTIFVRFLTKDDAQKYERCLALFEQAERGERQLVTSEAIIAEVIYVLTSRHLYQLARDAAAQRLRPIVANRGVTIEHKLSVMAALDLYEGSRLDFADCLAVVHTQRLGLEGVYSYDHDFDRVSVRRLEP